MKYFLIVLVLFNFCHEAKAQQEKVLVYTKTRGYRHASIPDGVKAVQRIGEANNFTVDTTSNNGAFTEENLKKYAALVFISTNGDLLNQAERTELERYIQDGGGFVGIHGASTGGREWPWYVELVGALFTNHPEPKEGMLIKEDYKNNASFHYPEKMIWKDEWYNFVKIQDGLHVLLSVDESSYIGGSNGKNHPIAWYREFDGGRIFYTAMGHFSHLYTDALFLEHIKAGFEFAMGNNVKLDYSKVKTPKP